jgi:hypothetical protein
MLIGSIVYGSDHPLLQVNDDVFVVNGFEKICASFGHRLE